MNKKLILLSILLTIGMLFTIGGVNAKPKLMSSAHSISGMREISFSAQATEAPPIDFLPTIAIPTIVINPTPGSGGAFVPFNYLTLLLFVVVGALILIALIAIIRRP